MKWIVINTINYKIVPYFLNDKNNLRFRSKSVTKGVNEYINPDEFE